MGEGFATTATSLDALSESYRTIAHNLANASTPGFKRTQSVFLQELTGRLAPGATDAAVSAQPGGSVRQLSSLDTTPGALTGTGRPLDVAIGGSGYLVVETPQGELYTRNGTLSLNSQRQLVDSSGRTIAGASGPIVIPPGVGEARIQISSDGVVSAGGQNIGQLKVVTVTGAGALRPVGGGCFAAAPGAAVSQATDPKIAQGFREASNVNPVEELVGLIAVSRLYEANMKTVKTLDERLANLNRIVMG